MQQKPDFENCQTLSDVFHKESSCHLEITSLEKILIFIILGCLHDLRFTMSENDNY